MTTPIRDFVARYARSGSARLHMPGHKGRGALGFESLDITEIAGADALYEANGIIAESEANASALFETRRTLYSTEGSSQCIRAMLHLAMIHARPDGGRPVALAGRNAHRAFLTAAALCDFDVEWLWPEAAADSVCSCPITPEGLSRRLDAMKETPFCVYVTSPDYLGGQLDIEALAAACHARNVPLLVDNAHGAYLKFLPGRAHPMELGADMCCDSAHKTLPALTGGAYLHISRGADPRYAVDAKQSLALFGSTSPSYLILQSLDCLNEALSADLPARLAACRARLDGLKAELAGRGFDVLPSDPLKLTLRTDGPRVAERLRAQGVECEFADSGHIVFMFTPSNPPEDFERLSRALGEPIPVEVCSEPLTPPPRALTARQAMFAPSETVPVQRAVNRVCAAPTAACPPAVALAVSGERITREIVRALQRNGTREIAVVRERS